MRFAPVAVAFAIVVALAALALSPARAEAPERRARCTPITTMAPDVIDLAARLELAVEAHLSADRATVQILPGTPAPGFVVCGW